MTRGTIDTKEYQALQRTSERRIHVLQTLSNISVQVNNYRETEPLTEYAVQRARGIVSADSAGLYLPSPKTGELALSGHAGDGETFRQRQTVLQPVINRVFEYGEPVLAHFPATAECMTGICLAAVPAIYRRTSVGVLLVTRRDTISRFDTEDISALSIIACHTGVALTKVREFGEFESQMRKISAAQEIGNALVTSRDLESILHLVVQRISEVIEADICSIMLLDKSGEHLTIVAAQGVDEDVKRSTLVRVGEGLSGWVAKEGRPLLIRDLESDPQFGRTSNLVYRGPSLLSVPLMVQNNILGVINVNSKRTCEPFTPADERLLTVFANQAAIAIENARLYKELETMATTDAVTGIYNHRAFQERLNEEVLRAERYGQPLSVIIMDVDHFKRVNDSYGHLEGDHVLREISSLFTQSFRKMDYIARYGGEEFAVILPHSPKEPSFQTADRVRKAVENASLIRSNPVAKITISMGVATFPEDGRDQKELLDRADQALYRAKQEGRNRVLAASRDIPVGATAR